MLKGVTTALLAGVSMLAMPSYAFADPVSIGSTVALALFQAGVPIAATYATFAAIGNFVIAAATIGLSYAFSRQQRPNLDPGRFKQTFSAEEVPERRAVGRVRIGGVKFFGNTSGYFTYRLFGLSRGLVDQIEAYYLGGREVVVDQGDGAVQSPPWVYNGAVYCHIQTRNGDGNEAAWPELKDTFPDLWTDDHRARGIWQAMVRFASPGTTSSRYLKIYGDPNGKNLEILGRAELIFDPREASHDINDQSTWDWTENGPLCCVHMMRSFPEFQDTAFDWADIAAEADKADAFVPIKGGGTEPRSRAGGVWESQGVSKKDLLTSMLNSIGADLYYTPNGITVRLLDDNMASTLSMPRRNMREAQIKLGSEGVERVNKCRVKYYSSERNYTLSELPLVKDDGITPLDWSVRQAEIDKIGEQPMQIDLPFCPSASQAQRIARRLFLIATSEIGVAKTDMAGLATWGRRCIELDLQDVGIDGQTKVLIQAPSVDDEAGTVEIPFIVHPTISAWDPAVDEANALPQIPEIQAETPINTPDPTAQAILVQYPSPDNSYEMRVDFTLDGTAGGAEANYRTYTNNLPDLWTSMNEVGKDFAWVDADAGFVGREIDTRVRGVSGENVSLFSDITKTDPLAIDNTAPDPISVAAATITPLSGAATLNATLNFSPSLNAVAFEIEGSTTIKVNARPGDTYVYQDTQGNPGTSGPSFTVTWRFYAIASDGTRSTVVELQGQTEPS